MFFQLARASGPCFVMGQSAGTAAAIAARTGTRPADIDIAALRAALRQQGAYLGDDMAVESSRAGKLAR